MCIYLQKASLHCLSIKRRPGCHGSRTSFREIEKLGPLMQPTSLFISSLQICAMHKKISLGNPTPPCLLPTLAARTACSSTNWRRPYLFPNVGYTPRWETYCIPHGSNEASKKELFLSPETVPGLLCQVWPSSSFLAVKLFGEKTFFCQKSEKRKGKRSLWPFSSTRSSGLQKSEWGTTGNWICRRGIKYSMFFGSQWDLYARVNIPLAA